MHTPQSSIHLAARASPRAARMVHRPLGNSAPATALQPSRLTICIPGGTVGWRATGGEVGNPGVPTRYNPLRVLKQAPRGIPHPALSPPRRLGLEPRQPALGNRTNARGATRARGWVQGRRVENRFARELAEPLAPNGRWLLALFDLIPARWMVRSPDTQTL